MGGLVELAMRTARKSSLIVGPCCLVIALGYAIYICSFLRSSSACTGTVVSLTARPGEDNLTAYAPIFTFVATNGQQYTITADVASTTPEFKVGQSVPVLYKSANPDKAKIDSFWQLWLFPVVFGFLGSFFTGVGYALLRYERWRDRRGLSIAT
jgi:Protein of unknown function (DUF3592)